jgi:hypothetical protein
LLVDASTSKAIALQISEYSGFAGSSRPDSVLAEREISLNTNLEKSAIILEKGHESAVTLEKVVFIA